MPNKEISDPLSRGPITLVPSSTTAYALGVASPKGNLNQSAAVSVGNTATLLLAANERRVSAIIYNNGSVTIYVGNASVTSSNGIPVAAATSFTDDASNGALYAITASSTADTRVAEVTAT